MVSPLPTMSSAAPDVPPPLEAIVQRALTKDRDQRFASAREMGLDLPGLEQAYDLYRRLEESGAGEDGTQALLRMYEGGEVAGA